jgi:hypothetical protein
MDLGQLDLTFCKGTDGVYRLMSCKETLHPITSDIKSDPAIDAIIKPFDTKVN